MMGGVWSPYAWMTIEDDRAAARLYGKGWKPSEIAVKLGFPTVEIRRALREFGFVVR